MMRYLALFLLLCGHAFAQTAGTVALPTGAGVNTPSTVSSAINTALAAKQDYSAVTVKGPGTASSGNCVKFNNTSGTLLADAGAPCATGGVSSFNTRTGAISLLSADVTAALGYTPPSSVAGRTGAVTLTHSDLTDWASATSSFLTSAPVSSVAGRTGAVTLTHSDLTDWSSATSGFLTSVPTATTSTQGTVKCDGTTIACTSGVISTVSGLRETLYTNGTAVGNGSDTTEDTLMSYTIPANTLANVGDRIEIKVACKLAANTDTKTFRVRIGTVSGTTLTSMQGTTTNHTACASSIWIMKTGSSTQAYGSLGSTNLNSSYDYVGTLALTDTAGITLYVTGQDSTAATSNAVQAQLFLVDFVR